MGAAWHHRTQLGSGGLRRGGEMAVADEVIQKGFDAAVASCSGDVHFRRAAAEKAK
ncbi:MAG TPA: hypothetical protein VF669_16600 [Tepidisphaeraceae bacterium]|jgi:hypothetical protein